MTDEELQAAERAEARDPSTKPERLIELMGLYVDDGLQNPALQLLVLEDPGFWRRLDSDHFTNVHYQVALSPHCPAAFVAWLLAQTTPDLKAAATGLAWNPTLPLGHRRAGLACHRFEAPAPLRPLSELLTADELGLLARAERAPDALAPEEVLRLTVLGGWGRWLAVRQARCPGELLAQAWREAGHDPEPKLVIVKHPNLPEALLVEALASNDARLRQAAEQHPRAPRRDGRGPTAKRR
jgi:hypothetical protein